jgi:hypothetical protein
MGGHCSQKLLLRRGSHSSPGRSRSSDQYDQQLYRKDRMPRDLVSKAFSFFPPAAARL